MYFQGGLTITLLCNGLHPGIIEALSLSKNSYTSGDLVANVEALQ